MSAVRRGISALLVIVVMLIPIGPTATFGQESPVVTARLGIAPGDAIEEAPMGTTGAALRAIIPVLWTTADELGVSIVSASVGQGFSSDEGVLESEKDLDLVVTGQRDAVELLARTLREAWDQSIVFIWYPQATPGEQATATIPLPRGADQLTDEIYEAMVLEITDGAHVWYAGPDSLLFVAKTNDTESDTAFYARMDRLVRLLNNFGIETGPMERGRADCTVVTSDLDGDRQHLRAASLDGRMYYGQYEKAGAGGPASQAGV